MAEKCRCIAQVVGSMLLIVLMSGCSLDAGTDGGAMDLRTFERGTSPNNALVCPTGVCRAKADGKSPVFPLAQKNLMERVKRVISVQPRTQLIASDEALDQLVFVQRSRLFGFPDTIWIQGLAVDAGSSLIIYSRSNYGYSDFGVNGDRVRRWLAALEEAP